MSIETSNAPTIRLPRDGRNLSEATKFVRSNFPAAKAVSVEKFFIVVHFAQEMPSTPASLEEAKEAADSILADFIGKIDAAFDRKSALELLTPIERKGIFDHERRTLFTVGNVYQDWSGAHLVLGYQDVPTWSVTTVSVREIKPGVWRKFGEPTTHRTYPGYHAPILAQQVDVE